MLDRDALFYLQAMGIDVYQSRDLAASVLPTVHRENVDAELDANVDAWASLQASVKQCQACALHASRTHTVFGVGSKTARVMFVGEAPGAQEDKQGLPFVGRAGQLLDNMLHAIGLSRDEVYIANVLKCRPPQNLDPQADEVARCTQYLDSQIQLIQPRLIVALGRIAAHYLLHCQTPLDKLRQSRHQYGAHNTPLLVTYHPAYLLRAPLEKRKAYQDLLQIKALIN